MSFLEIPLNTPSVGLLRRIMRFRVLITERWWQRPCLLVHWLHVMWSFTYLDTFIVAVELVFSILYSTITTAVQGSTCVSNIIILGMIFKWCSNCELITSQKARPRRPWPNQRESDVITSIVSAGFVEAAGDLVTCASAVETSEKGRAMLRI